MVMTAVKEVGGTGITTSKFGGSDGATTTKEESSHRILERKRKQVHNNKTPKNHRRMLKNKN
jgi:hypothetical protein